jgi:hypothetical protein
MNVAKTMTAAMAMIIMAGSELPSVSAANRG